MPLIAECNIRRNLTAPVVQGGSLHALATARTPAMTCCQGTPLRNEIEAMGDDAIARATDCAETAISETHGESEVSDPIQAHVIVATRP